MNYLHTSQNARISGANIRDLRFKLQKDCAPEIKGPGFWHLMRMGYGISVKGLNHHVTLHQD